MMKQNENEMNFSVPLEMIRYNKLRKLKRAKKKT